MRSSDLEDPKKHDAGIIASASIQEIGEEAKTATRNEHDMSFREVMALYPKVSPCPLIACFECLLLVYWAFRHLLCANAASPLGSNTSLRLYHLLHVFRLTKYI